MAISPNRENNGFMDYGKWVKQADLDLREGRGSRIGENLSQIKRSKIPRRWLKSVAAICRRAGMFAEGLKMLTPVIYPLHKGDEPASVEERAEYGALLLKYGSTREAGLWLNQLPVKPGSEIVLFRAFCSMAEWDYSSAAGELTYYLMGDVPEYQALIARVNLAACLVANEEYSKALELLNFNIASARAQQAFRLEGNCLELRAQTHIYRGEWKEAEENLNLSAKLLGQDPGNDLLFIKKWKAILDAVRSGSLESVESVYEEARRKNHWESLRDLDRFRLRVRFDQPLFDYLLFGTPYRHFRSRVLRELNLSAPATVYRWGSLDGPAIQVNTGEVDVGGGFDRQVLNVLAALSRDFYRPQRVGELFSALCPNQHFDIFSSQNRIAKIVSRTRQELRDSDIPLSIENSSGAHRLVRTGPVSLLLSYERGNAADPVFAKLQMAFPNQRFSAVEACQVLSMSRQRFQRWFKNAESASKIRKLSGGALTEYKLA